MTTHAWPGVALAMALGVAAPSAWAQAAPAPSYPAPPPGYMYVPIVPVVQVVPVVPVAPPAPAVAPAPATMGYSPALELPYVAGRPIPNGYHVYEEPRRALTVSGWVLTSVSYGAALFAGLASDFDNSSEYLVLPVAGPWLTLGRRDYANCPTNGAPNDGLDCAGDAAAMSGLIVDGIMQAGGMTLLLIGYLAPKKKLIYFPSALSVAPRRTAGGYGLTVGGAF